MDIRELSRAAYRAGTGEDLLAPRPRTSGLRYILDSRHAAIIISLLSLLSGIAVAWFHSAPTAVHAIAPGGEAGPVPAPEEEAVPPDGADTSPGAVDSPGQTEEQRTVVVYVSGQVASTGVLTLEAGARVVDAVEGAGGMTGEADTSALNLARVLVDGEHVYVPALGEAAPPDVLGGGPGTPATGGTLIQLNLATASDLESLPGIGPSTAAKIIAWREQNGAFTSVEELLEISGIGPAKFEAIKDLVSP